MLQTHSNVSVPRSTSRGRATPARRRQRWYEACKISSLGTTRDRPPPWVLRGIAHHRGYNARSPTTVGTTRDRPPPWVLSGIAHTVDMRRHRAPRSATVPRVHAPTRPVSQNTLETALLAHTRPERSVVHARSFRGTSHKKKGRPSHPSFMGCGVCL